MKTLAATLTAAGLLFGAVSTSQAGIRSAANLLFNGISGLDDLNILDARSPGAVGGVIFLASGTTLDEPSLTKAPGSLPIEAALNPYAMDTEVTVENWIVCVSRPLAESLVRARERSIEEAGKAYSELEAGRSCGRFAALRVILQESIYASSATAGYDARIFGALINIGGSWANGFVVSGAL